MSSGTEHGTQKSLSCVFHLRIDRPQSKVQKLRMKPNLSGLDLKTTRQPETLVGKERGGEILKSLSARTITFYKEKTWPACSNELLRPKSCDLKNMRASTLP